MITVVSIVVFRDAADVRVQFLLFHFQGRKVTTLIPWGANTLEWTTPIRPGHGNWEGEIPEVASLGL
jgi:cytochrome c oxidase subunit 1